MPHGVGVPTVHDARLLHAVSAVRSGVRYSLILFFGQAEAEESAEELAEFERFLASLPDECRSETVAEYDRLHGAATRALLAGAAELERARGQAVRAGARVRPCPLDDLR